MSSDNDGFDDEKVIPLRDYDRKRRHPPKALADLCNEAAEQALLGALLAENSAYHLIAGFLRPEHFSRDMHQRIYGALGALINRGEVANPITMQPFFDTELKNTGVGVKYLTDMTKADAGWVRASVVVPDYARQIVDLALRRQAIALLEGGLEAVQKVEPSKPANLVVTDFARELDRTAHNHRLNRKPGLDLTAPDDIAERRWAVDQWLPLLETIGLGGAGGEGKTTIAQMFCTAAALGGSALGLHFTTMKAACILCEDRPEDTRRRQRDINQALGCSSQDLDGRLLLLPRRGSKNYLGVFDKDHNLTLTPEFHEILAQTKDFGARFVVLDGRSDVFWGDQNEERHARAFVRQVTDRIAEELDGLVILLYQPSRAGRRDRTGESGSVQWDAAFRARLVLASPPPEPPDKIGAEPIDPDLRRLTRMKSNFSAAGESIDLKWSQGVFALAADVRGGTGQDTGKADRVFAEMVEAYTRMGRDVSPSKGTNYAPKLFAEDAHYNEGVGYTAFEKAMNSCLRRNLVKIETTRRGTKRLVKVGMGLF